MGSLILVRGEWDDKINIKDCTVEEGLKDCEAITQRLSTLSLVRYLIFDFVSKPPY